LKINICILSANIHSNAFYETAELLHYSFKELNIDSTISVNNIQKDANLNIFFGGHLLHREQFSIIPKDSVIFNTEPIYDDQVAARTAILELAEKFEIWDYSKINIEYFKSKNFTKIKLFKFGYQKELQRITKPVLQDIDVLFYGSINARRAKIIEELSQSGLKVKSLFGVYGKERDEFISRSKVILTVYYYNTKTFDIIRFFYLMANSKAIICESDIDFPIPSQYSRGVCGVDYDEIVSTVKYYVENSKLRTNLELQTLENLKSLPQVNFSKELFLPL